MPITINTFDLI